MRTIHAATVTLAILAAGCTHDPRETRGHLEPGNSIVVAQEALGQGSGGGSHDGATIGAVPFVDYRAPNIPVMQDGVVDYLFIFSTESLDGEAERDEHWIKVKVAEQSFTKAQRNAAKSLLNDEQTGIQREGIVPRSARLHAPGGGNGPIMPRVRANGQATTRVTVAEVDPSTGEPRVLGTQIVPSSPTGAPPTVTTMLNGMNAVQRDIATTAAALNQNQNQTPPPATTPGAFTPVPQADTGGTSSVPGKR